MLCYTFSLTFTNYGAKPKCKAPSTQKKMGETKSKKAQLPPKLPSPPRELLDHYEMGPSLQDVMTTLNSISAWLADHSVCFREMAMSREAQQVPEAPCAAENNKLSDTQPMDVFDCMEDAVRRQVAERLRGPTPVCPATTDKESGD